MLGYSKSYWGIPTLLRIYGSAFPRALPFAVFAALISLLIKLTWGNDWYYDNVWWAHPYPYAPFMFMAGFSIVFRNNQSYRRYWDGRTMFQQMTSSWLDAVHFAINFDGHGWKDDEGEEKQQRLIFEADIIHLTSLLHALACQNLRMDYDLSNLQTYEKCDLPLPHVRYDYGGFTSGGYKGMIHSIRSSPKAMALINQEQVLSVIGGINQNELTALGHTMEYVKKNSHQGIALQDGTYIPGPTERVHACLTWINQLLISRRHQGGLVQHPAILTRIYQVLSKGMEGFEQCRKLKNTPFPFPWAQAILGILVLFTITVPFFMCGFVVNKTFCVIMTFVVTLPYWVLNEVARDLEDPFWYDPNELPLCLYQYSVNYALENMKKSFFDVQFHGREQLGNEEQLGDETNGSSSSFTFQQVQMAQVYEKSSSKSKNL